MHFFHFDWEFSFFEISSNPINVRSPFNISNSFPNLYPPRKVLDVSFFAIVRRIKQMIGGITQATTTPNPFAERLVKIPKANKPSNGPYVIVARNKMS